MPPDGEYAKAAAIIHDYLYHCSLRDERIRFNISGWNDGTRCVPKWKRTLMYLAVGCLDGNIMTLILLV
ncbi:DUF1353 domain-containing protein [Salmonella enterica subsp. enterica serovar Weltevreden]|nr:DUF1353 domain-containing protein [Salmonella enterica subsp. enterica serovar Weltevreden]